MGRFVAVALGTAALVLSGCSDSGDDAEKKAASKSSESNRVEVNKYAHLLDALAKIEGGEQVDDVKFTPGAGPAKAAAEQNKAFGWSAKSEFRFAEIHRGGDRSCIVSDEAHLVQPGPVVDAEPLEYYLGDGDTCSYERSDAKVVYRFVTITDDGRLKYRAVKGADLAPKMVKTAPML